MTETPVSKPLMPSASFGNTNAQASTTDAVGGTFATPGNAPATYCNVGCGTNTIDATRVFTVSNVVTNTIVGATMLGTTAVNPSQVTISISTTAGLTQTIETKDIDPDSFTNKPVTVTVTYPFTPILSMGLGAVTLRGSSTVLHE